MGVDALTSTECTQEVIQASRTRLLHTHPYPYAGPAAQHSPFVFPTGKDFFFPQCRRQRSSCHLPYMDTPSHPKTVGDLASTSCKLSLYALKRPKRPDWNYLHGALCLSAHRRAFMSGLLQVLKTCGAKMTVIQILQQLQHSSCSPFPSSSNCKPQLFHFSSWNCVGTLVDINGSYFINRRPCGIYHHPRHYNIDFISSYKFPTFINQHSSPSSLHSARCLEPTTAARQQVHLTIALAPATLQRQAKKEAQKKGEWGENRATRVRFELTPPKGLAHYW